MVKVMYNDKLLYKVFIWVFFEIGLWQEREALTKYLISWFKSNVSKREPRQLDC